MQNLLNIVLLLSVFTISLPVEAKILFVDDNATGNGSGTLWVNAFKYLQDALLNASSGDENRVSSCVPWAGAAWNGERDGGATAIIEIRIPSGQGHA